LPEALTDFESAFLCASDKTFELVENLIVLLKFSVDLETALAGVLVVGDTDGDTDGDADGVVVGGGEVGGGEVGGVVHRVQVNGGHRLRR